MSGIARLVRKVKHKLGVDVRQWCCPKCPNGELFYQPFSSSSFYVCNKCGWLQLQHPSDDPQRVYER